MTEKQIYRLKNVILYILKEFSGGTDYIKLYKILYFANKEQLAEMGIPVIADRFKAWDLGPVPSLTGHIVKDLESHNTLEDSLSIFKGALKVRKNKLVKATETPDIDSIPLHTRKLLDKLVAKYKYYSGDKLSQISHDEAWREAYEINGGKDNGSETINPVSMAKVSGATPDMQKCVERLYSHNHNYVSIWNNDDNFDTLETSAIEICNLKNMGAGWDGDDAEEIEDQTADNCRLLLSYSKAIPNFVELVYPTPSGTLCIDWRSKAGKVSAELSERHFAFYFISNDKKDVYDSPVMELGEESYESLFHFLDKLKHAE